MHELIQIRCCMLLLLPVVCNMLPVVSVPRINMLLVEVTVPRCCIKNMHAQSLHIPFLCMHTCMACLAEEDSQNADHCWWVFLMQYIDAVAGLHGWKVPHAART